MGNPPPIPSDPNPIAHRRPWGKGRQEATGCLGV